MSKRKKPWCNLCRDHQPDFHCGGCKRGFHRDCLERTGQWRREEDNPKDYTCEECREEEDECLKCHIFVEGASLLICDECGGAYHSRCAGQPSDPEGDSDASWECDRCSAAKPRGAPVRPTGGRALGNVDICYVCQRTGKLLGCDTCEQSYHPTCLDPSSFETENEKWNCPLCKGEDPLVHMAHKRMGKRRRDQQSEQWQKCVREQNRERKKTRDLFLWQNRTVLLPFTGAAVINRLKKNVPAILHLDEAGSKKRKVPSRRGGGRLCDESEGGQHEAALPPSGAHAKQKTSYKPRPSPRNKVVWSSSSDNEDNDNNPQHSESKIVEDDQPSERIQRYARRTTSARSTGSTDSDGGHELKNPDEPSSHLTESQQPTPTKDDVPQPLSLPVTKADAQISPAVAKKADITMGEDGEADTLHERVSYSDETRLKAAESLPNVTILREGIELKRYQRWGVNWLLDAFFTRSGAILADEMGLGKTIQTIAFLSVLKALGVTGPHLVVVPLSTVGNWARELRRFAPHLRFTKICGSRQERMHSTSDNLARAGLYDCFISTYECVMNEEWFFTDLFQWQCVVLDEAHRLKNEAARIRHSLDRVDCTMRVLLTGTPLQNHVRELCVLLNFLFPDVLKDCDRIEQFVTSGDDDASKLDANATQALTQLLSRLMLRRTKELVVRLPRKIEVDVWLCLAPTAGALYKALLEAVADTAEAAADGSMRKLLGAVMKMRLLCSHPRAAVPTETQIAGLLRACEDSGWSSAKLAVVSELARDIQRTRNGWLHVAASNKLLFLDTLLCQLHNENYRRCDGYRRVYDEKRAYTLQQSIAQRRTEADRLHESQKKAPLPEESAKKLAQIEAEIALLETKGLDALESSKCPEFRAANSDTPDMYVRDMYPSDLEGWEAADAAALLDPSKGPRNHKVLVFTQFQLVLDELERYCCWRGWAYMRLDGSTNKVIRELDTREFNSNESSHLLYLISTRAGGLGINLVTANHVVLFDEDWNPFVDLQAIDRAHRIGQKRTVRVWKPMTEWTVEERMALRRMHKLQLDKQLIQANVDKAEEELDEPADQKITGDHVRKLIQYGRAAIGSANFKDAPTPQTLEDFLRREKKPLDTGCLEKAPTEPSDEEGADEEGVSLKEVLEEQTAPAEQVAEEEEDGGAAPSMLKRPKRERRQPRAIYTPTAWQTGPREERKIIRERKCFRCGLTGDGSNLNVKKKDEKDVAKKKDDTNETGVKSVSKQLLIGCQQCPKVYHLNDCLGLTTPPHHTWLCPWHECSICFRRAGAAGGVLLRCCDCPTAFCFDCFPPEYQRYTPPPAWFDDLERRGWAVNRQSLITFLCSRCKALRERERRKNLTKAQLEQENADRKTKDAAARAEAKALQEAERQAEKDRRAKDQAERKAISAAKKAADEETKDYQEKLRSVVDELFPPQWNEIVVAKAADFTQSQAANNTRAAATTEKPKKRLVLPDRFKTAGELLRFCDNCSLPRHDASVCPFPAESRRVVPTSVQATPDLTPFIPGESLETPEQPRTASEQPVAASSTQPPETTAPAVPTKPKGKSRLVCAHCGAVNHTRRFCPTLPPEDAKVYEQLRAKQQEVLSRLQVAQPLPTPPTLADACDSADFEPTTLPLKVYEASRRELMTKYEFVIEAVLVAVGGLPAPKRKAQQEHQQLRLTPGGMKREAVEGAAPPKRSKVSPVDERELRLSTILPPELSPRQSAPQQQQPQPEQRIVVQVPPTAATAERPAMVSEGSLISESPLISENDHPSIITGGAHPLYQHQQPLSQLGGSIAGRSEGWVDQAAWTMIGQLLQQQHRPQ